MQRRQQPAKKKPLGKAIAWTDQDMADMAHITPADIKAAVALWRNAAPKRLAGLLDASVQQQEPTNSYINRF
jgi:hypothetical protein